MRAFACFSVVRMPDDENVLTLSFCGDGNGCDVVFLGKVVPIHQTDCVDCLSNDELNGHDALAYAQSPPLQLCSTILRSF